MTTAVLVASLLGLIGYAVAAAGGRADSGSLTTSEASSTPGPLVDWQTLYLNEHRLATKRLRMAHRFERQRNAVIGQLRRRWAPTVDYAYRLASVVYGVSYRQLRSVGKCESHHYRFARNGQYRGVMQEGPMFERGPFARFGVWDPIANVFTAAYTVSRQGWRQWECKP